VSGNTDASITRISDDKTSFQAAAEMQNGDDFNIESTIDNSSANEHAVEVTVDSPAAIDVSVANPETGGAAGNVDATDANADSESENNAVKTGENTWLAKISGDDNTEGITLDAALKDTASPGSYDISVAINPVSSNN
jgi:hypothetical protein